MTEPTKPAIAPELQASLDLLTSWATLEHQEYPPYSLKEPTQAEHRIDVDADAVLQAANAMCQKLWDSLTVKGRSRWWDPARCSTVQLIHQLINHLEKGDMLDVMNLAMMLWFRVEPETEEERAAWRQEIHEMATAWAEQKLQERVEYWTDVFNQSEKDLRAELDRERAGELALANGEPITITSVVKAKDMLERYINAVMGQVQKAMPEGANLLVEFKNDARGKVRVSMTLGVVP